MEFLNLLKKESQELDRRLLIAGAIAGIINTLLIFVLTTAADRIADGRTAYRELAMVLVCLVGFWWSKGYLLTRSTRVIEEIVYNIRLRIAEKVRRTDLRAFERMDRASLYNAISSHTIVISRASTILVSAATSLVLLACAFLVIFLQSSTAFLLLVGALGLVIFTLFSQRTQLLDALKSIAQQDNVFVARFGDLLDGFKELKMDAAKSRDFVESALCPAAAKARELRTTGGLAVNKSVLVASSALFVLLSAVVFLLPVFAPGDAPKLVFIATLIVFIIGPMSEVVFSFSTLTDVNTSIAEIYRIEEKLDSAFEMGSHDDLVATPAPTRFEKIRCEGMTFAYHNEKGESAFSLEPFDFELTPGEIVFITGGNGSGKSTFLKVLAGLYPSDAGAITLDGSPVDHHLRPAYRGLYAPIFTDYHLFETLYGSHHIDETKVTEWLQRVDLLHKTSLDGRRITNTALSTGQRKRLALVLSLLEEKPILLLDEWAAEQDPIFRRKFYREILPELRALGKTVVAVSHDDDHYEVADRVLKMQYGKFVPVVEPEPPKKSGGSGRKKT
ncbi:MAG: cyclic peptide export ABC transporter [Verrucomicrobiota bacterium]